MVNYVNVMSNELPGLGIAFLIPFESSEYGNPEYKLYCKAFIIPFLCLALFPTPAPPPKKYGEWINLAQV